MTGSRLVRGLTQFCIFGDLVGIKIKIVYFVHNHVTDEIETQMANYFNKVLPVSFSLYPKLSSYL